MCRFTDFVEIQYQEFRLIISYTMYMFIVDGFSHSTNQPTNQLVNTSRRR